MSDGYLDLARQIGLRLCEEAIWHEGSATWLGDEKIRIGEEWDVVHRSLDGDLYGGTAGIGLFLERLWTATGEEDFRRVGLGAVAHSLDWAERRANDRSLYSGIGGVAAVAAEVGERFDDEGVRHAARSLAPRVLQGPPEPLADLIAGEAGRLLAALELGRRLAAPGALETARNIGRGLIDRAARHPYPGISWPESTDHPPLCGLGHGASGVALALGELWLASGDSEFLEASVQAAAYERAWYQREHLNWPDLRELTRDRLASGSAPTHPVFWCHGAIGIGLVRLRQFELTGERSFAAEAGAAIQCAERVLAAITEGRARPDLSLCHGLSAYAELFVAAAQTFNESRFLERAIQCAELAAVHAESGEWPSGVPDGGENPSLMLGFAGTGMMFLRVACPEVAPAGLLLTEPIMSERVIVQLDDLAPERFADAAKRLIEGMDGARVERISPRGRILIHLPVGLPAEAVLPRFQAQENVAYAEADLRDRLANAGED